MLSLKLIKNWRKMFKNERKLNKWTIKQIWQLLERNGIWKKKSVEIEWTTFLAKVKFETRIKRNKTKDLRVWSAEIRDEKQNGRVQKKVYVEKEIGRTLRVKITIVRIGRVVE